MVKRLSKGKPRCSDRRQTPRKSRHDAAVASTHTWLELRYRSRVTASLFGSAELFAFEQIDSSGYWFRCNRAVGRVFQLSARGLCCDTSKEDATADRKDKTKPIALYNRRDSERLLWVSIESVLKPLALKHPERMSIQQLEALFWK